MKVSNDPWEFIIRSLHPDLEKLQNMIEVDPLIKADLSKKNRRWQIKIIETWPVETFDLKWTFDVDALQLAVDWTDRALQSWDYVRRESWDTWSFNSKRDAEKFVTLYNVACPR